MLLYVGIIAVMAPVAMALPHYCDNCYDKYHYDNGVYNRRYDDTGYKLPYYDRRDVYRQGNDMPHYNSYYNRNNKGARIKWDPKSRRLSSGTYDSTPIRAGYGRVQKGLGINGKDAALRCEFYDYILSNVVWKKLSNGYSRYDDGLDHYRMFADWDPKQGVAMLYIYDVKPSDYGTYQCSGVTETSYGNTQTVAATVQFKSGYYN